MSVLMLVISVVSAYLVGSFPTSFIMAKLVKGIDIRQVGSKNAGATNVLRAVGKIPALVTLIVDILKGVLVVTIIADFFYGNFFTEVFDYDFYQGLLGFVVVAGHIWSIFLKFKGGKGVATTLGVALGIAPALLLPTLAIWTAVFFFTNYVSLASIIALISFPVIAAVFGYPFYTILLSIAICVLSIYKHTSNIQRLIKGEEARTYIFKRK